MLLYILLSACVGTVHLYSHGVVTSACSSMSPNHDGASAQTSSPPYTVTAVPTSFKEGDEITVTLRAVSGDFEGFMLQARRVETSIPIGTFTVTNTAEAQGLNCSEVANSAVSHKSDSEKTEIIVKWKAPTSGPLSNVEFRATFVKNKATFWEGVKSSAITYTGTSTPVTAAPTGPTSNSGCGKSKVCFSQPDNCDPTTNTACHFVSVQSSSQSEMQVQIVGPGSGYVAIGFSDDKSMGNDDIYICGKDKDGVPQVQRAFSTGRSAPNILSLGNVTDIKTSITNGVLNCSFTSRNVISTASRASGSQYYLMIASGPSSQGSIQEHTKTFVTQAKADLVNTTVIGSESTPVTAAPTGPTSNSGCGKSKVCFSQPNNCDPTTNTACHFVSVQSSSQSEMQVQIVGPGSGYVAIGFSDDQSMGNDDIYICGKDKDGVPQVQRAFSTGRSAPNILSLGNVTDIKTSITNGVLNCSFTSRNVISTASRASGSQYYLMIASGPASQGSILEHTKTFVTQDKADLLNPTVIGSEAEAYPAIVKAHGALMLIAWMTTGSVGMLIARYLKAVGKGRGCCGKDFWFLAHVTLMSLSIIATAIAFIIVFSYAQDWAGGAHPVLGCLVMILSLIQPLVAALRCDPQHEQRFIFNWAHSFNALAIKGLAVAAIFTGLALIGDTQGWMLGVMGGFVAWEALLYILQDLHMRARKKDSTICSFGMINTEVILLVVYILGNLAFLIALLVGIGRA
nr:putative ferric-chelate reductase 1 isoform X4 [Misgurnus anguillicaudatus]